MYIVAIAWMFVVVLMTAAEATSTQGSLLGAAITFLFYGVLPLSIVLYLMGTPARRAARRRAEQANSGTASSQNSAAPDGGSVPPCDPVSAEREKP